MMCDDVFSSTKKRISLTSDSIQTVRVKKAVSYTHLVYKRQEQAAVVNGSGVDVQKFCAEPRETKDRLVFLFAGRLLREKGLAEFIQAAKKMKESGFAAIFHVIGPIETLELDVELRNIFEVAMRQGTVQYFNKTENVKPYLQAADIFVLPTYREGRSKAILEAMAMKMPVITCDVAGCRGLVVDGINGFLVKMCIRDRP